MVQIARRVRQDGVYFATTDTWERRALFINTTLADIVVKQILACRERGFYKLHAFVLMPNHFHLLITPTISLERSLQVIKGGFSYRAKKELLFGGEIWQTSFYDRRVEILSSMKPLSSTSSRTQ